MRNLIQDLHTRVTDWLPDRKEPAAPADSDEPAAPKPVRHPAGVHAVGIDQRTHLCAVAYLSETGQTEMLRTGEGDLLKGRAAIR